MESEKKEESNLKTPSQFAGLVDKHPSADLQAKEDNEMAVESENKKVSTHEKPSHFAGHKTSGDAEDESPAITNSPTEKVNTKSQPPPHWMAVDSWDECLSNIHKWNSELTPREQENEIQKYKNFSSAERERLRKKLATLMSVYDSR